MATSNDIRATFLDSFARHGHTVVESSPLVRATTPLCSSPTPAWCSSRTCSPARNAGPIAAPPPRRNACAPAASTMIWTMSGYTARHHTFFEMLGNFSFGDYFKADWRSNIAWTLITQAISRLNPAESCWSPSIRKMMKLPPCGTSIAGLPDRPHHPHRHLRQFLAHGRYRPVRPVFSEIFYDHGPGIFQGGPPGSPDEDGDRFIEIWNLVFMQYRRRARPAPARHCRARPSTPAWGWNASPPFCKA